jgi:serine protease AprX
MVPIPSPLIEFMLLGPVEDRRQLQDSPILGDVWVQFGKEPRKEADVLISPYRGQHAGKVAEKIDTDLPEDRDARISFLQGLIVAKLTFKEVAEVVVPKTKWWLQRYHQEEVQPPPAAPAKKKGKKSEPKPPPEVREIHEFQQNYKREKVEAVVRTLRDSAKEWHSKIPSLQSQELPALDRFVALTGLLLWAADHEPPKDGTVSDGSPETPTVSASDQIKYILNHIQPEEIADLLIALGGKMLRDSVREPLVWSVSLNRPPLPALTKSIPAVKADAAHTLFKVDCSEIGWAVIDSGIDGAHPAFGDRIKRSFDFKNYRKIVSLSNLKKPLREKNVAALQADETWSNLKEKPDKPDEYLQRLAEDAKNRGPIHWELVEKFVEIDPKTKPSTSHGTHVAGILGANKKTAIAHPGAKDKGDFADGMCPDIQLYDFRVLGKDMEDAEFAIIAALQFIRYLNDRDNFLTIHGANLSLSIPHDVRNFACGRTPICNECEHLIESGVVVVAAAGNHGYKSFETKEGSYDSYAAFSITDPGNADGIITVGATHRYWPHTYGVSFFSSRGPTGDGRLKPDLVAPGERIRAPFARSGESHPPGGEWNDLDGTSMAAPHVSGAAAMLMGRYSELIGQPRRIKRILCESATDLGRERSFQGHGMLDVLRAFQSI